MELVQFALSVRDEERSLHWYTAGLGFQPAGRMTVANMPDAEALTRLPGVDFEARWATGHQPFFQLELFRFNAPAPEEMPQGWSRRDVGFTTMVFAVPDLPATVERLRRMGSPPLTPFVGAEGDRSVCVRDPDGALVELRECDPRPRSMPAGDPPGPRACAISATVPDLGRAKAYFGDTLGLQAAPEGALELHEAAHEALWGLAGASRRTADLQAGDLVIELVEYTAPAVRPRPPGWRLCDRGISHIALGTRSRQHCIDVVDAARDAGYELGATLSWPVVEATYITDGDGFTVELLTTSERDQAEIGFPKLVNHAAQWVPTP